MLENQAGPTPENRLSIASAQGGVSNPLISLCKAGTYAYRLASLSVYSRLYSKAPGNCTDTPDSIRIDVTFWDYVYGIWRLQTTLTYSL